MFKQCKAQPKAPWYLAGACLFLAACSSPPVVRDSGPSRPVDVSSIPDAEPRFEVRTRAGNKSPYTVLGKTYRVLPESDGFRERGLASWYGNKFHGRKTSNGEIYNMYGMTAAHKNLPIPSYVRVTNLDNQRSIVVRVNDRGPFHEGRVIDLSYAGASKLGFLKQGTARVEVEALPMARTSAQPQLIPLPEPIDVRGPVVGGAVVGGVVDAQRGAAAPEQSQLPAPGEQAGYKLPANTFLQAGAFGQQRSAVALQQRIDGLTDLPVKVVQKPAQDSLWRVQVGPVTNNLVLMNLRALLESNDIRSTHVVYE